MKKRLWSNLIFQMISNFLFFFFFFVAKGPNIVLLHFIHQKRTMKASKKSPIIVWLGKKLSTYFFFELLSIKFSRITARAKARDLFFNIISLFLAIEILCYIYLNLKDLLCLIRNDKSKCTIFGYFCRIVMPA